MEFNEEDLKRIFKEAHDEAEEKSRPEREKFRKKMDDIHLVVKGNEEAGITGMQDNVKCLMGYKLELRIMRWLRKTVVVAAGIGIVYFIKEHFFKKLW